MPTTFLSLPPEIRLQIYELCFTSNQILPFRPQRKIGWNRAPLDLSNPERLFSSESQQLLRTIFCECKLTKHDHAVALEALLDNARVLCIKHEDFATLQKLCSASVLPSVAVGLSGQARGFANIVKEHLRSLDFSDRLDEIVCQPSDLVKLLKNLTGLKSVFISSKHVQRYSGTVEEHIDFAKERAERELARAQDPEELGLSNMVNQTASETRDELRRMSLRSPVTDGNRLLLSPALFSGRNTPISGKASNSSQPSLVVVDLSLLVWQHFLYTGAPYRDHWRCAKMHTLLDTAEQQGITIVTRFPNVEFDPTTYARLIFRARRATHVVPDRRPENQKLRWTGTFRGEMSTADWTLRLRHKSSGLEFVVGQRRQHDLPVNQSQSGLAKCRHANKVLNVCQACAVLWCT